MSIVCSYTCTYVCIYYINVCRYTRFFICLLLIIIIVVVVREALLFSFVHCCCCACFYCSSVKRADIRLGNCPLSPLKFQQFAFNVYSGCQLFLQNVSVCLYVYMSICTSVYLLSKWTCVCLYLRVCMYVFK